MKQKIWEIVDLILKTISWGLIAFAILMLLLKWLKVIGSPDFEEIIFSWLIGITGWIVESNRRFAGWIVEINRKLASLETKLDMIWGDFKKRKKL